MWAYWSRTVSESHTGRGEMSQPEKRTLHTVPANCVGAGDTPQLAAVPAGDTPSRHSTGAGWVTSGRPGPLSLEAVEKSETQEEDEPD